MPPTPPNGSSTVPPRGRYACSMLSITSRTSRENFAGWSGFVVLVVVGTEFNDALLLRLGHAHFQQFQHAGQLESVNRSRIVDTPRHRRLSHRTDRHHQAHPIERHGPFTHDLRGQVVLVASHPRTSRD